MQHAKKMVLVPQDALQHSPSRGQIDQLRSVQTPGTTLSRLDAEMDDILRSVTPSNQCEKWKLYQQVLQRYQFFTDEERHPKISKTSVTSEKPAEQRAEEAVQEATETLRVTDETILDSVPKSYKEKAALLLKHFHDNSNARLTWNNSGVVHIDGEPIKDSNIADLVNEVMRKRKNTKAIGREQFGSELRLMGVPRELIGNTSLLYENLSLSPSNLFTPNTSQSNLNSSGPSSGKRRRTPTSETLRSWKTLKL